ncbi:SpoIIE family protein phosphatase [Streptomyces sp. SL13]|uniref:protein-serine/threonine phosphatase n=1 Tax=Streptantibioticus silvisoli TaxID=2705255 RepID=A0AA90KGR8_9ACTN|nr:SpoIIE family protein phosphatase [Streptantibioticus silvisoli]MDI5970890.1 SpoIIE family protein phosphatase [Streptantibioticus silvisoli]
MFTTDHAGRITAWGDRAAAVFGRPAAAALGLDWDVLFGPDESGRLTDALARARQGLPYSGVLTARSGDRLPSLTLNCSPLTGVSGDPVLACSVSGGGPGAVADGGPGAADAERNAVANAEPDAANAEPDVAKDTESDAAERQRAAVRAAFVDELVGKSPFGLLMLDEDLRFVLVNDSLSAINGVPVEAHTGRLVGDVMLTEDGGAYERMLRETLRTGEPVTGLMVRGRTEGHPDADRSWSVSLFRLASCDGRVRGLGGIVVDVTDKQAALLEASAARGRLALVNAANTRVGTTLDMPQIAEELISVAVPAFADLAVVKIREDLFGDTVPDVSGTPIRLRRLAGRAMDNPASSSIFRSHGETSQPPGSVLHECMRTGGAHLLADIDDEALQALAHDAEHARLVRGSGLTSMIVAPFVARGRVLGVALFGRSDKRDPMNVEDLKSAEELAARTAMCLDNALAYSNERRIAVALQRSMLPEDEVIPRRPGLEVAHHYRPSSNAAQVGGDWFDVIALSGHRVAFAVGDVMGHDLHAAANMGQLRTAMRTLAQLDLEPADLLTRLDEAVRRGTATRYATCVYAVCDTVTRECSIVSAGHPPPLLRHADGTTEVLAVSPGVPLGVSTDDPGFAVTDIVLPQDATLVLYTDGLVEHRGEDIDVGIDRLRTVLAEDGGSVRDLCERVATRLSPAGAEDDLAVLMARLSTSPDHGFATWLVDPRPESVAGVRAHLRRTLHAWDLPDLVDATTLLASELVTNALRYAHGTIELRLAKGASLVCEVADGDLRVPRRRQAGPDEEGGRGLAVVSEYSRSWGTRPTADGKIVWFELALPQG